MDNQPGVGRARGRSRGRPNPAQQEVRMPGSIPQPAEQAAGSVRPRVGLQGPRDVTPAPTMSRGRGITPERQQAVLGGGRGSILQRTGTSITTSSTTGSDLEREERESVASSLARTTISSQEGPGGANGNGNGLSKPGLGRGATRGIRDRGDRLVITKTRPDHIVSKQGTSGDGVELKSNYFLIKSSQEGQRLLKYHVEFSLESIQDITAVKKALLYGLRDAGQLPNFITDGMHLFVMEKLDEDPKVVETRTRKGEEVSIKLRLVEELRPTDHHFIVFYNIILRKMLENLKLELVGRNYYNPAPGSKIELKQHKLELWPGYETSIRQHEDNILLCCEVAHKILRTDTVLDQLGQIRRSQPANFHAAAEKALLGQVVLTRYNNKTYRITEILWDKNASGTFELTWKKGKTEEKSYVQFYEEKYNKKLRDPQQPLLVGKATTRDKRGGIMGPVYLIPELCFMTGLSEEQRANFQLMSQLAQYTRQDPKTRQQSLLKFANSVGSNQASTEMLEGFKLQFNQQLVQFRGRILKPETIKGAKKKEFKYKSENADWSGAFRDWKMWSVINLDKWAVIHPGKEKLTTGFINQLSKVAPSVGMLIKKPRIYELRNSNPASYVEVLNQAIADGAQLVMAVIPSNKGEQYAAVKKTCCLTHAIPSQCMTATVLGKEKGLMSVATKVAIQMACKLGGEPWAVDIPLKKTMVVGYDTYHDTVDKKKSVGAFVATLNDNFTRFTSSCDLHEPGQELTSNIRPAMLKALRKYKEVNGYPPEKIFMFRDGVGDGQIPHVKEQEVAELLKVFHESGMPDVKFTCVLVSKRINTKFFRGNDNPHSGTVVDSVVTLPERYDYFLVSQSVRQGTVNPTSYNVIHDGVGLKPDQLQKLTYKLTHLYYNWPGTVRVPAVCQYAHKLAFLVGETLHRTPQEGLADLLFYL